MLGVRLVGMIRWIAGLAAFLLFSLPAFAQGDFLSPGSAYSVGQPVRPAAILVHPSFIPAAPGISLIPEHSLALQTFLDGKESSRAQAQYAAIMIAPHIAADQSMVVKMTASFEEVRTPFLRQVRVPLISIGSGRIQLSGFQSVAPTVSSICGLPSKAGASGASATQQCHTGIRAPRNNRSYGLSLRLRFSKQDADRAGNGLWNATRQTMSWGRAFLTL